jgi:hypothetical protein
MMYSSYSFTTSALDGGERLASRPDYLIQVQFFTHTEGFQKITALASSAALCTQVSTNAAVKFKFPGFKLCQIQVVIGASLK